MFCPLSRGRLGKAVGDNDDDYNVFIDEASAALMTHAYKALCRDQTKSPTLLTYKPTATLNEVWAATQLIMDDVSWVVRCRHQTRGLLSVRRTVKPV